MPGRAMIVVDLAVAMVAAAGIAAERRSRRWSPAFAALGVALIVLDDIPAPFATTRVACPGIYQVLQARPERGAVAELPLGIGDGLGDVTDGSADPDRRGSVAGDLRHATLSGCQRSPRLMIRCMTLS